MARHRAESLLITDQSASAAMTVLAAVEPQALVVDHRRISRDSTVPKDVYDQLKAMPRLSLGCEHRQADEDYAKKRGTFFKFGMSDAAVKLAASDLETQFTRLRAYKGLIAHLSPGLQVQGDSVDKNFEWRRFAFSVLIY